MEKSKQQQQQQQRQQQKRQQQQQRYKQQTLLSTKSFSRPRRKTYQKLFEKVNQEMTSHILNTLIHQSNS